MPFRFNRKSRDFRALAVIFWMFAGAAVVEADTVTATWNANSEPDISGYFLHYGTQSGVYSTSINVGNVVTRQVVLAPGFRYYFAVKAYNSSQLFSPFSAEAFIDIPGANNPPVLTNPGNRTNAENASISLQLSASDPDGTVLTYSATNLPGGLSVNSTTGLISGTLSYTSAGSYAVTATASDGSLSNSKTFTWTVTNVNRAPVLTAPANQATPKSTAVSLTLSASDPDGTPLTYSATGLPPGLSVNSASGLISGTLTSSLANYSVMATASDGSLSNSKTFTWTVNNVNRAPVLTAPPSQTNAENATVSLALSATDPDSNLLTYSAIGLPGGLAINSTTGVIGGRPSYTSAGGYTVTASASDGLATTSVSFSWTITNTVPPVSVLSDRSDAQGAAVMLAVTASDPDGNPLTYTASWLPDVSGWRIVGVNDVDGDGQSDLVWRQIQNGDVAIWLLDGTTVKQAPVVASGVPLAWQMVGTGDLDGDGKADLVWRHTQTGDVSVWLMNGVTVKAAPVVAAGVPLAWQIVGTGDLDGDGKADLVWRSTQTGDVSVWLMDGVTVKAAPVVAAGVPLAWRIDSVGDLDGDGKADLIWRHMQTGDVAAWLMNGVSVRQGPIVSAGVPLEFQIVGVKDVDGDGKADLVWRHMPTGNVAVWLMNGVALKRMPAVN